jgi:hypothetical protein
MVKIRTILTICILLIFVIPTSFGQSATETASCPINITDVEISLINVMKVQAMGSMGMPNGGNMGMNPVATATTKNSNRQLHFILKVANNSSKMVTVIHWEARFIDQQDQVIDKQFRTKKKIKPGKDEFNDDSQWQDSNKDIAASFIYRSMNLAPPK